MSQPILSIITINYNNKKGLIKTFNSVLCQSFKEYEYIIIDGGSTDGSKDHIIKYQDKVTYWTSEKDNGIYDAMNKGIEKAKGEYLLFLNSGDSLVDENVLEEISKILTDRTYDIVYGNVRVDENIIKYSPKKLDILNILNFGISHQAFFFKRILFEKAGQYNIVYNVVADVCHLILCLVRLNATNLYINISIAKIEPGGISSISCKDNLVQRQLFFDTELSALSNDYKLLLRYHKNNYLQRLRQSILRRLKL